MLNIKYDIEYIIKQCNDFFGKNDIYKHLKKRNMQAYFRKTNNGYAPITYNTRRPGGRYRFIQDMHEQGIQNAFANNNTGLKNLDPKLCLEQNEIF